MNFMFEWQKQYCTCHENRRTDDGVLYDFSKFSDHFPKIVQDLSEGHTNIFRKCPKFAKDFRGRPEDFSIIHQRI